MSRFWSKIVKQLTPYTPGEQPQIDNLIKLNTNENPYGPSPAVLSAIDLANAESLRKYPDPNARVLKAAIADYYSDFGIQTNNVFVGNSSDEVLAHTFRALLKQNKPLLFPDITYSFYPVYCNLFEIDFKQVPLRDDYSINVEDFDPDNGGIIFANPNAPTGLALTIDQVRALLEQSPNSVVVMDEAYIDFAEGNVRSAVELVTQYPNLLVTQTLSKSRNLAGLRVGLAIGDSQLIEGLERIKNSFHPYALDSLALAGASASFLDRAYFESCCEKVKNTRAQFTQTLEQLGFTVLPSHANFVFATHPEHSAQSLFEGLRANNIVVRYFDKPRLSDFLRISIGTDEEMGICANVLADLIQGS
ncbi:MAG: histidinol-phosphate transaminase [Acidiferrobacterales bacterium]|nr:histidinol-phosphate transaminase [Acidiferrobacterales bacterium]